MTEFGFLRARRREPAPTSRSSAPPGSPVADFLTGRSVRPGRERSPKIPDAQQNSLDLGSSPEPVSVPEQSPAPAPGAGLLDLGSSPEPIVQEQQPDRRPVPASGGGLLDLSTPSTPAQGPVHTARTGRFAPLINHDLGLPSLEEAERRILTVDDPVVHLSRMQSSAGALEFTAATARANQLLLGCLFETSDQKESAVLPGLRPQGPNPQSPIFRSTTQGVSVNLRSVKDISRFFVIGLPQTSDRSMPGGTLVIATYGGSRLEVVLDTSATYGAKALVTGYVVEGRIVLRAEHDPFSGTLQQVAGVYGYDQMTWRDPFTPLF